MNLRLAGILALVVLGLMALFCFSNGSFCFMCVTLQPHHHASTDRYGPTCLKCLCAAQADFRDNDRDGDGMNQFWRGDVAGLYTLVPKNARPTLDAIKLIEISVASAD